MQDSEKLLLVGGAATLGLMILTSTSDPNNESFTLSYNNGVLVVNGQVINNILTVVIDGHVYAASDVIGIATAIGSLGHGNHTLVVTHAFGTPQTWQFTT